MCQRCRRPKVIKEKKMAETKDPEGKDFNTNRKHVMSFHIYEVPTKDGARDHEIEVEAAMGGLNLRYNTTFDKVREFFTQKRETGKPATLKAVK